MEQKGIRLLDMIIIEFTSIVEGLTRDYAIENNRLIVDREVFRKSLEKYGYMSFQEKTKIYKALNFIIHDKNNYTMPCKDPVLKRTIRKVVINFSAYTVIKQLHETVIPQ